MRRSASPTIVADTREKTPFKFKGHRVCRAALTTGDYSVKGRELEVAVERKSPTDLGVSILCNWSRFQKEMERSMDFDSFVVIIEGSMADCIRAASRSRAHRGPLISRIAYLSSVYRVCFLFCDNRESAEKATLEALRPFF
jgi:ERCC4-type nuclease